VRRFALALAGVAALSAAACRREAAPRRDEVTPAISSPSAVPRSSRALVDDLAELALGDVLAPDVATARAAALDAGSLTLEDLIDELLADPRLGSRTAPSLLVRDHFSASNLPILLVLAQTPLRSLAGYTGEHGAPDERVYVLRQPLCSASEVIKVAPWWAMDTKVSVCPDAYQPSVRGDGKYQCGARLLDQVNSPVCGCGPNLVQCARDELMLGELRGAARSEVVDTIADTVNRDRPLAEVFLRQDSVRGLIAEMLDRRWQIIYWTDCYLNRHSFLFIPCELYFFISIL
jgi:hypothetical protein